MGHSELLMLGASQTMAANVIKGWPNIRPDDKKRFPREPWRISLASEQA
jgi:hypothetical protein